MGPLRKRKPAVVRVGINGQTSIMTLFEKKTHLNQGQESVSEPPASRKPAKAIHCKIQMTLEGRKLALLRRPKSRFTLPNSEKVEAKLKYGTDVEKIILTTIAAHLKEPVVRQKEGSRFDYKVGGMGSLDHAESKSTSSLRESMLINKDKLENKPPGRLWLVFSNLRGVWIMEYERGDFESKFGPARHEAGWTRLVFEVPVKYMTPIALFQ